MKITKVTPMTMGTDWRNITFVKVETDEGLTGVADVRALNRTETVVGYLSESVPRYVLGADPFEIESLVHRMTLQDFGRAGEVVMTGVALIEIACWDIVGQALGQPVYRLLGGAVRDKIKAYANGWYTVERTPDEFHAAATRVVERGYLALKFDPFGAGFYEIERAEKRRVVSLVEAVRDAVGSRRRYPRRDARSLQPCHRHRDGQRARSLQAKLVRRAYAARKPGRAQEGGRRHCAARHPHRHRRTHAHALRIP